MVKQRSEAKQQQIAKAAIKSARKTTIRKPVKPSRKKHVKDSTIGAVWVALGIVVCVAVVVLAILIIDWLTYKHSCDYEDGSLNQRNELAIPITQCRKRSVFFLE